MRKVTLLVLAGLVLLLGACDPATPTPTPIVGVTEARARIAQFYPRVDGSTSAHPLQVWLACEILGVSCAWQQELPWEDTRRILPDPLVELDAEVAQTIYEVQHSGTHQAYVNLIEGEADFILVARAPSEDELQAARTRRVLLDLQPVALDAFVFLVNGGNPVDTLPLETIRDVYTGQITDWSDLEALTSPVGEADTTIRTYSRNPNSGSQELIEKLVMRGAEMVDSPDLMLMSMSGPIMAIGGDPYGIGYSVYFYAAFMQPHEQVKLLGVDGVLPTSANIADRSYPLVTEVFAVVRSGMPRGHPAMLLRDWLLTPDGQATLAESGYVPIGNEA